MELRYLLAVVTGAGSGLGREIAVALGRAGCAVLVADRALAMAQETVALVAESRVRSWALQVDLAEDAEVRMLAARARDLGGADLLVNNAAGWTAGRQYPDADPAAWGRTLDLALRTPMLLTQLVLADAAERPARRPGTPAVVNVASSAAAPAAGEHGYASPEYAAAKAGLVRFTTALADRTDTRVTAVVPGWIGLDRAHEERAGLPDSERDVLPPLVPPAEVTRCVLDLLAGGRPGEVVEVAGGRPPSVVAPALVGDPDRRSVRWDA